MAFFDNLESMVSNTIILSHELEFMNKDKIKIPNVDINKVIKLSNSENDTLLILSDGRMLRIKYDSDTKKSTMYSATPIKIEDETLIF